MTRARNLVAALFFSFFALASGASPARAQVPGPLHIEDERFVDSTGRTVILRGLNVSGASKLAPFLPDRTRFEPLKEWGVNVIRLLFIWEGYEPVRGQYNEHYLDELVRTAETAAELGIHVIIDFHQDSFSPYVAAGCGSGFPYWTVPKLWRRGQPGQGPKNCGPLWAMKGIVHPGMHTAFRKFYENHDGVRDSFLEVWRRIARRFSTVGGILGYDILNEPWGNERGHLGRLYDDAARVIRAEHPSSLLFITPHAMTVFGSIQSRLRKPHFTGFAYSAHFYDMDASSKLKWDPVSGIDGVRRHIGFLAKTAHDWNVPLFLGEFGAIAALENSAQFMDAHYSVLDGLQASGAQWSYTPEWTPEHKDGWNDEDLSIVDDHGNLRPHYRPRTYVQAVSGRIVSMTENSAGYRIIWDHNPSLGETEFYFAGEIRNLRTDGIAPDCRVIAPHRLSCRASQSGLASLSFETIAPSRPIP